MRSKSNASCKYCKKYCKREDVVVKREKETVTGEPGRGFTWQPHMGHHANLSVVVCKL